MAEQAAKNTDVELWREVLGDFYAPSIHMTQDGGIGIDVSGHVIVKPVRDWHGQADEIERLRAALRPFAAAWYNDNGDVTISTGHITRADYARANDALTKSHD